MAEVGGDDEGVRVVGEVRGQQGAEGGFGGWGGAADHHGDQAGVGGGGPGGVERAQEMVDVGEVEL